LNLKIIRYELCSTNNIYLFLWLELIYQYNDKKKIKKIALKLYIAPKRGT